VAIEIWQCVVLNFVIEHFEWKPAAVAAVCALLSSFAERTKIAISCGRKPSFALAFSQFTNSPGLLLDRVQNFELSEVPVEQRDRRVALLRVPIHIREFWPKQPISLLPDLVGGSVVDSQCR